MLADVPVIERDDAHDRRDDKEDDERVRDAVGASGGDPFERRKALAELKSGCSVVGVPASDAAIDQEAAKRHDEGLQVHSRDEKPMHPAKDHAETDNDENGEDPRQVIVHEQVNEDDADEFVVIATALGLTVTGPWPPYSFAETQA